MNSPRAVHRLSAMKPDKLPVEPGQHHHLFQSQTMAPLKSTRHFNPPPDYSRRTSLRLTHLPSSPPSSYLTTRHRSCYHKPTFSMQKKRVVFADELGQPLTVEHVFTPEPCSPPPPSATKTCTRHLESQQNPANKSLIPKLCLGFPPPTKDFDAFATRLQEKCIQMHSCSISDNVLIGEVYVFHSSPQKNVSLKVTFDSWRSLKDIPCKFLEHRLFHGLDVDVFSFEVCLLQNTDRSERIEFCFTFIPGQSSAVYWDDNMKQNYKVLKEKKRSCAGKDHTKQFYPLLSKYRPLVLPQWPSYLKKYNNLTHLHSHLLSSGTLGAFRYALREPLCWVG